MYSAFKTILMLLALGDYMNFPILEILDTTIPITAFGWFLIYILLPSPSPKDNSCNCHCNCDKKTNFRYDD